MATAAMTHDMQICRQICVRLDKLRPAVFSAKPPTGDACPKEGAAAEAPPPKPNAGVVVPKPEEAAELPPKLPKAAGV